MLGKILSYPATVKRFPCPTAGRCLLALAFLALASWACDGDRQGAAEYRILLRGQPVTQAFVLRLELAEAVMLADAELTRPADQRHLHPEGRLLPGPGGFNAPWSWHLDPQASGLAEVSIELCDGTPEQVEANLENWLRAGRFCPWNGYIAERL